MLQKIPHILIKKICYTRKRVKNLRLLATYVTRMGWIRDMYKILVGKSERKRQPGRPKHR